MKDQDKTKETLIRELKELRRRVIFLENRMTEQDPLSKGSLENDTPKLSRKEIWRLPGYWH